MNKRELLSERSLSLSRRIALSHADSGKSSNRLTADGWREKCTSELPEIALRGDGGRSGFAAGGLHRFRYTLIRTNKGAPMGGRF
jgi:hypothetical protein